RFDLGQRFSETLLERGLEGSAFAPAFEDPVATRVEHDVIGIGLLPRPGKEDQVSRPQLVALDPLGLAQLVARIPGQYHPFSEIRPIDEARAIDAFFR